ncbi:helix-turn-helix domain-containing protein [Rhodovibrionaceae bacterium A322]
MSSPALKQVKDAAHPIDIHVGNRLRQRRVAVGLTQDKLAKAIGITFQQIQKYERGMNRIVASRLFELAKVLKIDVGYFFLELPDETQAAQENHDTTNGTAKSLSDMMTERETLSLVRAYHQIENPVVRRQIVDLLKSLSPNA